MRNLILMLAILFSGIVSAQTTVGHLLRASHTDPADGTTRLFTVAPGGTTLSIEGSETEVYTVVDVPFVLPLYPAASEWLPAWNISAVSSSATNFVQTRTVNGIEETRTITYRYALQTPLYTWGGDPYYGLRSDVNRISAGVDAAKREARRISGLGSGSTTGVYVFSRPIYSVDSSITFDGISTLVGSPIGAPVPYVENGNPVIYTNGVLVVPTFSTAEEWAPLINIEGVLPRHITLPESYDIGDSMEITVLLSEVPSFDADDDIDVGVYVERNGVSTEVSGSYGYLVSVVGSRVTIGFDSAHGLSPDENIAVVFY